MAKEKTIVDELSYDWNKLELADVAQDYLKQEGGDSPLVKKSLDLLLQDIGASDPGILRTLTDPEVIQKTIKNELDFYYEGLQNQTVGDRFKYYSKTIEKYLGAESGKVQEKLQSFLDTKYQEIHKKVISAEHTISGKKKGVEGISDEDVESAKETLKKYAEVYETLHILEQQRKSELRNRVEDAYYEDRFKEIYLSKPKETSK